eukprot:TRINITY_DN15135_c0_g2_i1.p1 TRINITY_DN15135_c0_g2~~TRINITY_DN15135_c0_g2_i1.p1  ORF type:complete len:410 (-),score=34.49 TRINITY_DN15135_c0_g2_i1:1069-2298(-)
MYLSLPQDKEAIKNHMVAYMAKTGSVSKTLFGIELGNVCKTPTRGRTKILVEAFPDVFISDGDMVHLSPSYQLLSQPQPVPPSQPAPSNPTCYSVHPVHYTQPQVPPPTPASGYYQQPSPFVTTQWEQVQMQIPPPPPVHPISTSFVMNTPNLGSRQALGYVTDPVRYVEGTQGKQMFHQYSLPLSSGGQEQQYVHFFPQVHSVSDFQREQLVLESEEIEQVLPSEEETVEVLKSHEGSLEVNQLLLKLGARESDPFGQAKIFEFLTNCASVIIQDGIAYVNQLPEEYSPQAVSQPDLANIDEPSRDQSIDTAIFKSTLPGSSQQLEQYQISSNIQDIQVLDNDMSEDRSFFNAADTVEIDSIVVNNIQIETVNLHIHVKDLETMQASGVEQLKAQLSELLSKLTQQNL